MTKRIDRTALYARVSTRDQTTETQVFEMQRAAEERGWSVVDTFVDEGQSGKKTRRPQLDRLMREVRAGRISRVVVWKYDRFGRSVAHLVNSLAEFEARGIQFVSLRDGMDTSTPMGQFAFHQLAAVAQFESAIISERTAAGMANAKRKGRRLGRKQAASVDSVIELIAAGKSVRTTAAELKVGVATVSRRVAEARAVGLLPAA